ncbi:MAG: hypothetical protein CL874_03500 [Dehalococcoidales bacterium]|nr:hypothetical protein [Dehalococcoidales bacterium]MDP6576412.1 hypothetical protein [Dehalococcoidales bacterium]
MGQKLVRHLQIIWDYGKKLTIATGRYSVARKIAERIPDKQLQKDLEKDRRRAFDLGSTEVKVITPSGMSGVLRLASVFIAWRSSANADGEKKE